jgi:XTP/dITP diphosphohydrolase
MSSPLTIYVASSNAGKLRDFAAAARDVRNVEFLSLPGLKEIPPPPEDAATFEENAVLKARAYSRYAPGALVLADDSGLEVDALGGAPGVRSARYAEDAGFDPAGDFSTDERNNLLLIENLRSVTPSRRTARFRAVLVVARDGECVHVAHGTVEGMILEAPRGTGGFGYDPLFFLPELDRTMAEISAEEKDRASHRGKALRELLRLIRA